MPSLVKQKVLGASRRCAGLTVQCGNSICCGVFGLQYARTLGMLKRICLPLAALALAGCHAESSWSGEIASADRAQFDREVYPVLLADCAFSRCHGAPERFFQVFGPGRLRLTNPDGSDPLPLEMQASYERARSMLVTDGSRPLAESPLLLKPLDPSAGGTSHRGVDVFGRNVYRFVTDPGYATLVRWALQGATQTAPPASMIAAPIAGGAAPTNNGATPINTGVAGAAPINSGTNSNALPGTVP
jgi:hypothetical protein